MGSDRPGGSRPLTPVPAAVARYAEGEDRHRAVARALHAGPPPRSVQVADRLVALREQVALLRARAVELHGKLLEREQSGDPDVRDLRQRLMASVMRIESVVNALTETPDPAERPRAKGTDAP